MPHKFPGLISSLIVLIAAAAFPGDDAASIAIFEGFQLQPREARSFAFSAPEIPDGKDAVIVFNARLEFDKPAGFNPCMQVTINGAPLEARRLLNKRYAEERVDGSTQSMGAGELLTVPYAPDFESTDSHANYAFKSAKAAEFAIRVTDLLNRAANTIEFSNKIGSGLTNALVVGEGRLELRAAASAAGLAPAPEGELPLFVPKRAFDVNYSLARSGDWGLELTIAGQEFLVETEISTPLGEWVKSSNDLFTLTHQIEAREESIVVRDTLFNQTDRMLPLMQRRTIKMKPDKVWLAGLSPDSRIGRAAEPANPTVFAAVNGVGIGMLPLDDVSRVHVANFSDGESIGFSDESFVLQPGRSITVEWALVPNETGDYFDFINAVRRLLDVNFKIEGSFAFLRIDPRNVGTWSDEKIEEFVANKNAKYLCVTIAQPLYESPSGAHYPHGTAFQTLDLSGWKTEVARRRSLLPRVHQLAYFHCFLDVLDGAEEKYAGARLIDPSGAHATYGEPHEKLFLPLGGNAFSDDIAKNIGVILNDVGMDGVYWDEMEYSRHQYHYGEPWDGVSADIDPETMQILRPKSSVTLLTQDWRMAMASQLVAKHPLVANGPPHTRTMTALQFPRFVETGSISNCTLAQLFTPIALGDHLTERSEEDAYQVMLRALDYGCLYYWYNDLTVVPTHPHLTQYMFPITPVELHEGYVIGEDRIITNRSGQFGWGDVSLHETHIFDETGRERTDVKAPIRLVLGRTVTELRIPEGWSAAILKKDIR